MPGMHGSYAANMALNNCDVMIALGTRFDDRVTSRLAAFAPHAKVIHVDIDPAEIGKNRAPDVPIVGDVKRILPKLNRLIAEMQSAEAKTPAVEERSAARRAWWQQVRAWKQEHPLQVTTSEAEIKPQHLMGEIDRISGGHAIVASDVGQHQMWAAQLIRFSEPRLLAQLGRPGIDGIRPARGHRRAVRQPGEAGRSRWWATAASRCPFRNCPPSRATACPSRSWS